MKGRRRLKSARTAQLKWRMMLVLTTPGLSALAVTPARPHRQQGGDPGDPKSLGEQQEQPPT